MPAEQSEDSQWWFQAVYSAVQQIPHGKCTNYGHIALLVGFPRRARQVGVCLKHLPSYDPEDPEKFFFHDRNVPWQRVVNSKGGISPRGDGGAAANRQAEKLRDEGVDVEDARGVEEMTVDLGRFGWFPERLPRGESEDEDEDEDRYYGDSDGD